VEDLLSTLNLPEWPASEVILQILCATLASNISKSSDQNAVMRMLSVDLLGNILSKVKQEMNLVHQKPLYVPTPQQVC
jgi:cohesin loading factor subunit SCC2